MASPAHAESEGGFLIIEAAMVMLFMMALVFTISPSITDFVDDARKVHTRHDLSTIAVSVTRMVDQVWSERKRSRSFAVYSLLVGPGGVPVRGRAEAAGWDASPGSRSVGLLNDQLQENAAGYTPHTWGNPFGWRGPYVQDPVEPDPWGQRYAVNVGALFRPGLDMIVLSAGPDGRADMPFAQDGGMPTGDDLVALVSPTGDLR